MAFSVVDYKVERVKNAFSGEKCLEKACHLQTSFQDFIMHTSFASVGNTRQHGSSTFWGGDKIYFLHAYIVQIVQKGEIFGGNHSPQIPPAIHGTIIHWRCLSEVWLLSNFLQLAKTSPIEWDFMAGMEYSFWSAIYTIGTTKYE